MTDTQKAAAAGALAGAGIGALAYSYLQNSKKGNLGEEISEKKAPSNVVAKLSALKGEARWEPYDGCTAAAWVGYQFSDVCCLFPITPSTPMGELCDTWSSNKVLNVFDQPTRIQQMQSEAGAAGAVHGALVVGGFASTFTASQGLLLMIPNMYKIAGEMIPCVFHIPARAIAGAALSIFGDHSDIMAVRQTGWALLCAHNVQETMDMALASHIATLKAKVPFVHFFDGMRTSHEIQKISVFKQSQVKAVAELLEAEMDHHRSRGLNPTHPHIRGTAQSGDIYFQNVEAANKYYDAVPEIVEEALDWIFALTGRKYSLFDYFGHPNAEYVLVAMGSGATVAEEVIEYLKSVSKVKFGILKVRLFRPFSVKHFLSKLPKSVKRICVMDRTKEPGAQGEQLFCDVSTALQTAGRGDILCIGGRYGLAGKDFNPQQVKAILDNIAQPDASKVKHGWTVGITDDITFRSLPLSAPIDSCPKETVQTLIWGFGSDGTVGANKNAIKIIATNTQLYAQGHFAYDALKAGGVTISHLRFGPKPIKASYEIAAGCTYVAIHKREYLYQFDADLLLGPIVDGGTFVLNSPYVTMAMMEEKLPGSMKRIIADRRLKFYNIDANDVARKTGMGKLINNIMQACFFQLAEVLPVEQALGLLKDAVKKTYKSKGPEVVDKNIKAVDQALSSLNTVNYPESWKDAQLEGPKKQRGPEVPTFVKEVLDPMHLRRGGDLPVSKFEPGGCVEPGHTQWAKRGVALCVPVVDPDKCTQCNKCSAICPHAVIRPFLLSPEEVKQAPKAFDVRKATGGNQYAGLYFRIQASPLDCTGCEVCVHACPDNALKMTPIDEVLEAGHRKNWDFAQTLPSRGWRFDPFSLKGSQFQQPLVEFSGACEGCGETPYMKMMTQLFGERMIVANATGCTSIWGGTAGWVPYTTNKESGRGPAWGNSLFEDNAEYGLGMVLAVKQRRQQLSDRVETAIKSASDKMSLELQSALEQWLEVKENGKMSEKFGAQIVALIEKEGLVEAAYIRDVYRFRDLLPKPSMWMLGGDGWSNDIGYGGIDHVLALGQNVNIVVVDTEVYSNTGGQSSKATPLGSVAKFASGGKRQQKKDLLSVGLQYGNVYCASVALGANYTQAVKAFMEAEAYDGPSLIVCYAPCIEHRTKTGLSKMGNDMRNAVECGYWPLYRYNPDRAKIGEAPFQLDSKVVKGDPIKFLMNQNRYAQLARSNPGDAEQLQKDLKKFLVARHAKMKKQAEDKLEVDTEKDASQVGNVNLPELVILYGSETGTTEQLAKKFAGVCKKRGFKIRMSGELDEVDDLPSTCMDALTVVMCATCGDGDFPANSNSFWSMLSSDELQSDYLKGIDFTVFGMGDSSYAKYCEAARLIDRRLAALGGTRLMDMGEGNDRAEDKWETGFNEWLAKFWDKTNAPEPADADQISAPLFEIKELAADVKLPYEQICPPNAVLLPVEQNIRMTPQDYERDIRHLRISNKEQDAPFALGDAVSIYPQNDPSEVNEVMNWFGLKGDQVLSVKCLEPENVSSRLTQAFASRRTVQQIFEELLDCFGRPSRSFYEQLAKFATKKSDKERLLKHAEGGEEYKKLVGLSVTFFDVFQMFPSAKPPLEQLLTLIPVMKPRLYSIANSSFYDPGAIELTIVINQWKAADNTLKTGGCTKYIQRVPVGAKLAFQVVCGTFQFPPDDTYPMVMTGLGTGIAPIRSFVQDRLYQKRQGKATGPMVVFYGCRHEKEEFFYKEEWKMYKKEGVLTELVNAFSHDKPHYPPKMIFVQNKMEDNPDVMYKYLYEQKGYFYMCGPAFATPGIEAATKKTVGEKAKLSASQVDEWFEKLHLEGRYSIESY